MQHCSTCTCTPNVVGLTAVADCAFGILKSGIVTTGAFKREECAEVFEQGSQVGAILAVNASGGAYKVATLNGDLWFPVMLVSPYAPEKVY